MKKSLFFILFFLQPSITNSLIVNRHISSDNRMATKIDSIVQMAIIPFMSDSSRIGLSCGIYKNGGVFCYSYGTLEKGKQNLPSERTIYEIGSISKTFTGTLLAQAVKDDKVKIDDDIRNYLDGSYPNLEYDGNPIKMFYLINHTSGLPFFLPDNPKLFENANFDILPFTICDIQKNYSKEKFFEDLHKVKLDTIPGNKFHYSNAGAQLLKYILEKVYDMPYDKLLNKYISKPLDLKSTNSEYSKNELADLAKGYNGKGILMPYNPQSLDAAGGIYSTVSDMLKYIKFHLDETNEIIAISHKPRWGNINDYATGLNWQEKLTPDGLKRIWQSGGTFGFSSYCALYPQLNFGIIILTNESDPNTQGELEEAAKVIFEAIKK